MQPLLHCGHSKMHPAEENRLPAGDHCTAMRGVILGNVIRVLGHSKDRGPVL